MAGGKLLLHRVLPWCSVAAEGGGLGKGVGESFRREGMYVYVFLLSYGRNQHNVVNKLYFN